MLISFYSRNTKDLYLLNFKVKIEKVVLLQHDRNESLRIISAKKFPSTNRLAFVSCIY